MKHIILILILLLSGLAARAENMVSVSSTSGHPQDEVTLQVSLANIDAAVAFQAEIPLGSQLTYVTGSVALNPDRVTDHQVSAAVVNGSLRIYAFSLSLTPFVGNEGDLLSFTLKLKNEPGDYALELNETKLSDAAGNALPVTTSNGMVTILSPKLQINTPSLDFGHVPIRSEYTQNASMTNVGNEPLVITSINFSNAVFSCPSFTETTLQPGGNAYFTFKFAPLQKGALTATATIVSNSIAGNGIINLVADPFAVNEIHIDYVSGYCDSVVEVPISMNNMEAIMGFQIDMNLPQALEYVDFTLSNRKADHVSVGVFNEGLLRLMAYSASGSAFTGDDGVIGTLKLRLRGLYGYYGLEPFKVVLADANGENALSDYYSGYVDIRSPQIYGNESIDMGSSAVTEIITREYEVYNYGNAPMRIDQVVFDQSDFSVAETMPIVVEQYANTTLHVSYSREQKGDFNALMKIYSNDPQNGLKNVALSGSRYEPNSLEISAFSIGGNDVTVSLAMNNYSDVVALQADFIYPYQDYSVSSSDFQLTGRFSNHSLFATPINDSTFRILVLSFQNASVDGHEGVILNINLHPRGTPLEEEYSIYLTNILLSGSEGLNVFTGEEVSASFVLMFTQIIPLSVGWNWVSFNVDITLDELKAALVEALPGSAISIKSQTQNTSYNPNNNRWVGSLAWDVAKMYMIKVVAPCEITFEGLPINPSEHPVSILNGANWIGFPLNSSMTLSNAFAGFAINGDKIKSQTNNALYNGIRWQGQLNTLEPGKGYIYISNSSEGRVFTFPTSAK